MAERSASEQHKRKNESLVTSGCADGDLVRKHQRKTRRHLDDLGRLHRVVGSNGHLLSLISLQQVTSIDQSGMIMVPNDEHSYQFARNLPCGRLPRWPAVLWRGITTISCDDGRQRGDADSPRSSCGCSFAARRTRALRQNHRPSLSQPCALAAVDAAVPSERLLGAPNRSAANI